MGMQQFLKFFYISFFLFETDFDIFITVIR